MSNPKISTLTLSGKAGDLGESLSTLRKYVVEVAQQAGLETKYAHRLRLAVDEVAANIIMYGYKATPEGGVINVSSVIDDDRLTVTLEDTGVQYDPTQREMPENFDDPLEDREIGGLGIYLAIRNVDEFSYRRVDNRNINQFVMKRQTEKG
ncbi:MAG: ATP-binding protein [Anaerolineae bacterium]|nr:ATP-binding protein [Anaerolineae bacterium]